RRLLRPRRANASASDLRAGGNRLSRGPRRSRGNPLLDRAGTACDLRGVVPAVHAAQERRGPRPLRSWTGVRRHQDGAGDPLHGNRDDLGLSNGTLSYHLRTLEVAGFIRSERDGMYKRFFAADAQPEGGGEGIRLSQLQKMLIELLRRNPESAQRDLALRAGVTQQTVSYN